ncbi:hypothetical protein HPB48_014860 [Haemaphysalis longicornis]|uniref:Coiled-coil domain-containing protein 22 homolog n=1 Tax=Haemaphysalis longicornis TaxID=44386 RepID=A0A9J6GFI8_HAELO|nr:hypothetical protein HPB48_014860 [Haemaphysalis longicornis]
MEEVDQIIIHALRQIGCDFDEDVVSLKQFTTEITVEGVVRCLRLISPDRELPLHVSTNMVERYNLGMTLANACIMSCLQYTVLHMYGFLGELVIQGNNNYWRNKGHTKQEHRQRKKERIQKRVADAFQQSLLSSDQSKVDVAKLLASLTSTSSQQPTSTKESKFTRAEKLQFTKEEEPKQASGSDASLQLPKQSSEEEAEAKVKQMQNQLESISETISQLEVQEKELSAALQQIAGDTEKKKLQRLELESQNELEHKALALLPDADENIAKLQGKIDAAAQKLVSLSTQWEKHRAPLIEEYRQLKEQCSKRLVSEYEKLPKDVNRSSYTKRITEIVGNIKKQKEEIAKVLLDTRSLQKEINQLTGKLDRTFTVTDELIFKDAKKDEAVRRAYKYLASVHENSNQLLQAVEETGSILREMRDLEDQIEQESQKKVTANLERITADYKQMKQENATLLAQLKGQ